MTGPWEDYQPRQGGPWMDYQPPAIEQPSPAIDAAKSLAGGIEKGAAALPMILPNLINQAVAGPQLLGRGIASMADKALGIPEQPRGELWKPFYGSEDILSQLPESLQPHVPQTAAGVGTDILGQLAGNIGAGKTLQATAPKISEFLANEQGGKPPSEIPTQEDIRNASNANYQQMRDAGATLNKNGIDKVTSNITNELNKTGLMNPSLHGDTISVIKQMNEDAASGSMDLEKLDQYRQLLNQAVSKNTSKIEGANPDAYKANVAIHALDDAVDSLGSQHISNPQAIESLNNARALYSASSKMGDIQRIMNNAQYADVPSTAIKNGFKTLSKQLDVNPRGYTPEEIKAINEAAKTGILTGALKFMGSRIIGGIAGATGGAVGGGPIGAAVGTAIGGTVGTPFRAAANALQTSKGQNVINMIGNRPSVQSAMNPNYIPPQAPNYPSIMPAVGASLNASQQAQQRLKPQAPQIQQPEPPLAPQSNAQPDLMGKFAQAESGGNPNAKNPNSSASGILQFTKDTWAQMVGKYGKSTGITLQDKGNPEAQRIMGKLYADDNAKYLNSKLDRNPTNGEIYMAHFLGPQGAVKLIQAQGTGKQAIMLFPRADVNANRSIFFNNGKPRTVEEVYSLLDKKVA